MLPQSPLFPRPFIVIGHRGAAGIEPENTLRSFARAIELGADALELDVYAIEGQLVVIHDDKLDRTTNGRGLVQNTSFEQLRALDAGQGERIPTLAEVVELASPTSTPINIELKGKGTAEPVAALIDDVDRYLVSSFDHAELRHFRAFRADISVAPLFGRWRDDAVDIGRELNAIAINLGDRIVTRERVDEITEAGFRVLVYTVNSVSRARTLAEWGVAGVFTDRPDFLVPAFR